MGEENWKILGSKICDLRLAKGWGQSDLARNVGSSITTISRWETGSNVPRRAHYVIALKRELGLTDEDFQQAYGVPPSSNLQKKERYRAFSFATAAERLGSFELLDKARREIDDDFPVPEEPDEHGTDEQWFELLKLSPDTGGVVMQSDNFVVGYWECLAVNDDTYDAILRGENVNQSIAPKDIVVLMTSGVFNMYFDDLFLRKTHNNFITRKLMTIDFLTFLRETAQEGIFFNRIAANITGVEVKYLCQNWGFRKVTEHQEHMYIDSMGKVVPAEIYELMIGPDARRLLSLDPELFKIYKLHGFIES